MKIFFAVVVPAKNMTLGYILETSASQREPYLAEIAASDEVIVGEYSTVRQAHEALALAMTRTVGPMQ